MRKMASIIGNFTWAIPTMPFSQAHFRRMQAFYINQVKRAGFDLKINDTLSPESIQDLEWWSRNLDLQREKVFLDSKKLR